MSTSTGSGGVVIDNSRIYSPTEIKAEGIKLKVEPLANAIGFYLPGTPDEAHVSIKWLEDNPRFQLESDLETLVKACAFSYEEDPSINVTGIKGYKDIQLVSPPCSQLVINSDCYGRYRRPHIYLYDADGVKMWKMLEALAKLSFADFPVELAITDTRETTCLFDFRFASSLLPTSPAHMFSIDSRSTPHSGAPRSASLKLKPFLLRSTRPVPSVVVSPPDSPNYNQLSRSKYSVPSAVPNPVSRKRLPETKDDENHFDATRSNEGRRTESDVFAREIGQYFSRKGEEIQAERKSSGEVTDSTSTFRATKPLPTLPLNIARQPTLPSIHELSIIDETSELSYLSDSFPSPSSLTSSSSSSSPTRFDINRLSEYLEELESSTQELDERFERDNVEESIYGNYFWYYKDVKGELQLSKGIEVSAE